MDQQLKESILDKVVDIYLHEMNEEDMQYIENRILDYLQERINKRFLDNEETAAEAATAQ